MAHGTCDECKHHDRTGWPSGEWDSEPDRLEFEHAGLNCVIHRGGSGALCGYVGIPKSHPMHGKDYDAVHSEMPDLEVHGGLTYANECQGAVCHVPKEVEDESLWWLGFDCAHSGDVCPAHLRFHGRMSDYERYKNVDYVRKETECLAEQLAT